ncbi:hypothetical protein [Streptomyces sulfonofaciens]|nr:hypothetical protein [Streptomyces sulfonofaciens]
MALQHREQGVEMALRGAGPGGVGEGDEQRPMRDRKNDPRTLVIP